MNECCVFFTAIVRKEGSHAFASFTHHLRESRFPKANEVVCAAFNDGKEPLDEKKCILMHNDVARSLTCFTLLTRSEKRGLRKEGLRSNKQLKLTGIRNDLLKTQKQ